MRDTHPSFDRFDPEEFASAPYLEATDEREAVDASVLDEHERPTLIP